VSAGTTAITAIATPPQPSPCRGCPPTRFQRCPSSPPRSQLRCPKLDSPIQPSTWS
jgi:hypothetical protein